MDNDPLARPLMAEAVPVPSQSYAEPPWPTDDEPGPFQRTLDEPRRTGHIWSAPYQVEIPEMGTTPTQVNVISLTINGATMMVLRSHAEIEATEPVARALINYFGLQLLIVDDEGIGMLNDEEMRAAGWVRA